MPTGNGEENNRQSQLVALLKKPLIWLSALAIAALGGVLTTFATGILEPLLDSASVRDRLASDPPVTVVAADEYADFGWVFDHEVPPDAIADYDVAIQADESAGTRYMNSLGGWVRVTEGVTLVLQGNRAKPVTITRLFPQLIECVDLPTASIVATHPEGENSNPQLYADLDHHDPDFLDGRSSSGAPQPYFNAHSITLAEDEPITVYLHTFAFARACTWTIGVDAVSGGDEVSFTLDLHRPPFKISGSAATFTQAYGRAYLWSEYIKDQTHQFGPLRSDQLCQPDCRLDRKDLFP